MNAMEPSSLVQTSAENPYAAPTHSGMVVERRAFTDIPTPDLKRLRNDSHSIRAVVGLFILGLVLMLLITFAAIFSGSGIGSPELMIMALIGAMQSLAMVGLILRTNWGRAVGFLSATLMLIGFPIGTLIGIFFLTALIRGAKLFGPNRLVHKELETEWRYRKKNKVP